MLKDSLERVTSEGISSQCKNFKNNPTVTGPEDRDYYADLKWFIGFAFGNKSEMGLLQPIKFILTGFVLKQNAQGIQQGLGIRTDQFFGDVADQFTN